MYDRQYTPAEVCEIFDLSKSTLFRWERDGWILPPDRDIRQQRLYTQKHMRDIGRLLLQRQYQQLARAEREPGIEKRMDALLEKISLTKFTVFGDMSGLYELAERDTLSEETIQQLLREASERDPSDIAFQGIIKEVVGRRTREPEVWGWK